jgi:hypothetical protein
LYRRLLVVLAGFGALGAALWFLGCGGYRGGFFLCAGLLGAVGVAGTLAALPSGTPSRGVITAVFALLALIVAGRLIVAAPLSRGHLAKDMSHLRLPFFEQLSERRSGHSTCRPHCPVVTRRYRGPDTGNAATFSVLAAALQRDGYVTRIRDVTGAAVGDHVRVVARRVTITATVAHDPAQLSPTGEVLKRGVSRITVTFAARRP